MRIRPSTFLTSDTHFGHFAMTKYQNRSEDFGEEIISAWNSVVSKHDIVLHLGDLAMGNKEKMSGWTKRLRGKKYLILGNHDSQTDGFYADCGFTVIPDAHESFHDKYDKYTHYLFTHEPVFDLPDGWYNIHGHNHGNSHRGNVPDGFRHFDVGVDAIGYQPVRLSKIMDTLMVQTAKSKYEKVLGEYRNRKIVDFIFEKKETPIKHHGLVTDCCLSPDFDPWGFPVGDGTFDEKCLVCYKKTDVHFQE